MGWERRHLVAFAAILLQLFAIAFAAVWPLPLPLFVCLFVCLFAFVSFAFARCQRL